MTPTIRAQPIDTTGIAWQPLDLPRAFVVRGVWSDWFRWQPALHAAGYDYDTAYAVKSAFYRPNQNIRRWPMNQAELLSNYSVVVIANVDAVSLQPERLAQLEAFVERGGGLVVLGGYWAYSRGGYDGTPLVDMLPVTMPKQNRIPPLDGERLHAALGATWPMDYAFDQKPLAFYVQQLEPKADATVQVRVGDQPAIITGSFGQGRVVAVSLTSNGQAKPGQLAFWDWQDWPRLLGDAVAWAGAGRPLDGGEKSAKPTRPNPDAMDMLVLEPDRLDDAMVQRMLAHPSAQVAEAFFNVLCSPVGRERDWSPQVIMTMTRYARLDWIDRIEPQLTTGQPVGSHAAALLQVLGATQHPRARVMLLTALRNSTLRTAAIQGLRELGDAEALPQIQQIHAEAVDACMSEKVPGKVDPELFAKEEGDLLMHAVLARYHLGDDNALGELLAMHRETVFLHKVFENAGKKRVGEPQTTAGQKAQFERSLIHDKAKNLAGKVELMRLHAGPVPANLRTAFTTFAREASHPDDVKWIVAALRAHHAQSVPFNWQSLADANDGLARAAARRFGTSDK